MKDTKEIILQDSPDAATYRTDIKGWVSKNGRFYGDGPSGERAARWDSCTHVKCECGAVTSKHWTHCDICREKRKHERWLQRPVGEWDGNGIIYSDRLNEYLTEDEIEEKREEHGHLDLVICEPIKLRPLDSGYWEEELSLEDDYAELPQAVCDAIDALNAELEKMHPVTWEPGRLRVPNPPAPSSPRD